MKQFAKVLAVAAAIGCATTMLGQQAAVAPVAPKPQALATRNPFPAVDAKNFTAASPTAPQVNAFLKAIWGYDPNRLWEVAAIEKTAAPGVAKVVVFVADATQPGKGSRMVFFITPDGKHAISGDVMDFGPKPFAVNRALLEADTTSPARGAKSNALELVEFADFQCTQCKDAQSVMDQLATDFPEAKIVFENFPESDQHPYAMVAAAEGDCVQKEKGDDAFFAYAHVVFATQGALTAGGYEAALASAATRAGADPVAAAACAATPAARAEVMASHSLGEQVGVTAVPVLAVNGHVLPLTGIPYETLKKIVAYQAQQDGLTVHLQPTLSTLQ